MTFFAYFAGYVITSLFFFRYPNILHNRKRVPFRARHISHRGGAGENYENTMTAYQRAVAVGTDMIELDVYLTKDKKVVVVHDQNLLRSTGVDRDISSLTYSELPLLRERLTLDFDPVSDDINLLPVPDDEQDISDIPMIRERRLHNSKSDKMFHGSGKPEDRKFVLLEHVFKHFPKLPINVDVKVNDDFLINEVGRLIKGYDRERETVWGNFDYSITEKCYKLNPDICLLFSLRKVLLLIVLLYTGLLPFCPLKETHLEIFIPSVYLRKRTASKSSSEMLHQLWLKTLDQVLMRPALFEHLRKRGIQTYLWVLNYEEDFRKAFEFGVDGVMTDYPTRLKRFLDENPQYTSNNHL